MCYVSLRIKIHVYKIKMTNNNELTKYIGIKTEYTPRTVVWLDNIFNCLVDDRTVKEEWKVTWYDPKWDFVRCCVSLKKIN
jgi:hypothetical protein